MVHLKGQKVKGQKVKGSSLSLPAHGCGGARAIPFSAALFAKQKTKFGDGGREGRAGIPFPRTPFPSRPARAFGWEAACLCVSKEAKPAKISHLLEEKFARAPFQKMNEIFAGFARRAAPPSRWAGLPPVGRQLPGVPLEIGSSGVVKLHQYLTFRDFARHSRGALRRGIGKHWLAAHGAARQAEVRISCDFKYLLCPIKL